MAAQVALDDLVDHRHAHRRRQRIASKRVPVGELDLGGRRAQEGRAHVLPRDHRSQRYRPARKPLARANDVGTGVKRLGGEHRPGAAEPRDDLVVDEHHVVTAAGGGQQLEELVGRRGQPGRVRNGLDHHGGHGRRVFGDDAILHRRGREAVGLVPGGEAVAVVQRQESLDEAGHLRLELRLPLARAAGPHGAERAAVIAAVKTDEFVLPRLPRLLEVLADELQGRLDRFRPAAEGLDVFQRCRERPSQVSPRNPTPRR